MTEAEKALLDYVLALDLNDLAERSGECFALRDIRKRVLQERLPPGFREELKQALLASYQARQRESALVSTHEWACTGERGLVHVLYAELWEEGRIPK